MTDVFLPILMINMYVLVFFMLMLNSKEILQKLSKAHMQNLLTLIVFQCDDEVMHVEIQDFRFSFV